MTKEEYEAKVSELCTEGIKKAIKEYGLLINPDYIGKIFYIGFDTGLSCGKYVDWKKEDSNNKQ